MLYLKSGQQKNDFQEQSTKQEAYFLANYDFKEDLEVAKKDEIDIETSLVERYGVKIIGEMSSTNKWDFEIRFPKDGSTGGVEVKTDFMVGDTGNTVVEFECRGKPSGIETTQARYYLYKFHLNNIVEYYMIGTKMLKWVIKQAFYVRIVSGGDKGSNTKMYLFRLKTFIKYSTKLDI